MSDPDNLEVPILMDNSSQTLTNECPNSDCNGKMEYTDLQGLPVVDCPKLERSEVYLPGMEVPEGLEECPIIQRIREENENG